MKNYVVAFAAAFILLAVSHQSALALENESNPRFQQLQDKRLEVKERVATKQAAQRQNQIEHLKQVFTNILGRFSAALNRLDKIVGKLESRMDKLDAQGVNTSAARVKLADCANKKLLAQSAIDNAKAKVAAIDPASATVRQAVQTSVDALKAAKRAIANYHKCLVDVTRSLKATKPKEGTTSAE